MRPTLQVARDLLGMVIVRRRRTVTLAGRIVETEAYLGEQDAASHAYRGMSKRNEVMFGPAGHLYVYFTYGMHYCCNVVTEEEGTARAVLIRALEPLEGIRVMARNRKIDLPRNVESGTPPPAFFQLSNGPAKICQALGIGRDENGTDLCGSSIWIAGNLTRPARTSIMTSTRVGITEGTGHEWRFYFKDNPFVSRGRPVVPLKEARTTGI
jgi:DNA-3-methyladenine glycosylase